MTEHIATDYRNKEALFMNFLIPAGQLAEIAAAAFPTQVVCGNHPSRAQFADRVFFTLNLASCYAINPANSDLKALRDALVALATTLSIGLRQNGVKAVEGVLDQGNFTALLRGQQLRILADDVTAPLQTVLTAIGFTAETCSAWFENQLSVPTPITRQGRINKWRTLVRNTEWSRCMQLLGLGPKQLKRNRFSSRIGVELAPALWRETFSGIARTPVTPALAASPVTDSPKAAPPTSEAASASLAALPTATSPTYRLPAGVTVSSTNDGRLKIQGTFDPNEFLSSTQAQELRKAANAVSPELHAVLAVCSYDQVCEFPDLAGAVERAHQWRLAQNAGRAAVQKEFGQWRLAQLTESVKAKLSLNFNTEERGILLKLLAAEHAASAPAQPPTK